ncbi:MAG: hypothetical protein J6X75_01685 [Clostridia bacterium]|nr:hypothetical protein [Clostridia bacterium]
MKTRMINSQMSNFATYNMYFRQMLALAENVFEFENLNKFVDVSYLNKTLLRQGSIAFFKDEILGLLALPYRSLSTLDIYGRPKKIEVFSKANNYHRILKKKEFVIMYDNNGRYPLYLDISQMAQRIANCVRTQDINISQQKTPRVWKASSDSLTTIRGMLNNIDSNVESVVAHESAAAIDDLECVLQPAPYVADKIDLHLKELWAEYFRLIGVANIQEQKRERVIQDEMIASQGGTIASRYSRFQPRQNAIDQINERFKENLSVRYYDGIPDMKGDSEDVSDVLSISANDSKLI